MTIIVTDLDTLFQALIDVEDSIPDPNDYVDWWCIQHKPIQCEGCGQQVCYVEPPHHHLIVVWEEKDDSDMLRLAGRLMEIDMDPIIIKYAPLMGRCIPYPEVKKRGL